LFITRYNIPLRVPSETAALAERGRFDRDPASYVEEQMS